MNRNYTSDDKSGYFSSFRTAMKHWPAPEVIEPKHAVGQYRLAIKSKPLIVETATLFAQTVSCDRTDDMRMILTNSFYEELVFTLRFTKTPNGFAASGQHQKEGLQVMSLSTHF